MEDYGTVEVTFTDCHYGWRVRDDGISEDNDLSHDAAYATGDLDSLVPMTVRTFDGRDLTGIDRIVKAYAPRQPEARVGFGGSDGVPAQSRMANLSPVGTTWDMEVDVTGLDLGDAGDRLARATEKHLRFRNTYVGTDAKLVRQYVPMTLGRCVVEGGEFPGVNCPFTIPADAKDAQGRPLMVTPAKSGAGTEKPSCEVQAPQPAPLSARTGKVRIDLRGETYMVMWEAGAVDGRDFHEFDQFCDKRYLDARMDEDQYLRGSVPAGDFTFGTTIHVPMTEVTDATSSAGSTPGNR